MCNKQSALELPIDFGGQGLMLLANVCVSGDAILCIALVLKKAVFALFDAGDISV